MRANKANWALSYAKAERIDREAAWLWTGIVRAPVSEPAASPAGVGFASIRVHSRFSPEQNNLKKVLRAQNAYAELATSGDGTFLPAGFPTLTSLASVTGRFAYSCPQATLASTVERFKGFNGF